MSVEMYRSQLVRLVKEMADLEDKKAKETKKVTKLQSEINRISRSVTKNTTGASLRSKQRQIETKSKAASDSQTKAAKFDATISKNLTNQDRVQRQLDRAVQSAEKKRDTEAKKRRDTELRHAKDLTWEVQKQNRLHSDKIGSEAIQKLPEKIKVLFFAANPQDQDQLRLDEEIRDITQKIRLSDYRDSVDLISRWAVRPNDLLQALNEDKPNIVHFSGHGSDTDEILFLDPEGNTKAVSKEAMVQLMATTGDYVRVVLFNTCYSRNQAQAVAQHVDVAIGMGTAVGDEVARVFAAQFYSAIGFGLSVERAFAQGLVALSVEGIPEEDTPELFVREGVSADDIVLVRPQEGA